MRVGSVIVFFSLLLTGCWDNHVAKDTEIGSQYRYAFDVGTDGWSGGFADYPEAEQSSYGFGFVHTVLPEPLDGNDGAVVIFGNNGHDSLFMYMTHQIIGLDANTTYMVHISVEFASNVWENMTGIAGTSGEGVLMKAGAVSYSPRVERDNQGFLRINIDKGNLYNGGNDMHVIGDISNDTNESIYTLKTFQTDIPLEVTSDENGSLWVIVGADVGVQGNTMIYYNTVNVSLQ